MVNKPPLQKIGESQGSSSYQTTTFQINTSSKKYSQNSYQRTPTGSKGIVNQKQMGSTPGSAKHAHSIKFSFPSNDLPLSPKKTDKKFPLPSSSKQGSVKGEQLVK
jgi:hypothetical protein